jgi:hypothetical protein
MFQYNASEKQITNWRKKVYELNGNPEIFESLARIPNHDKFALANASAALRKLSAIQKVFFFISIKYFYLFKFNYHFILYFFLFFLFSYLDWIRKN